MFAGDRSHPAPAPARSRLTIAAFVAAAVGLIVALLVLMPSANATSGGAERSSTTTTSTSAVNGVRTLARDAAAVTQGSPEARSGDLAPAAFAPLVGVGPATNARVAEATAALADSVPSPPTACPAPGAEFVDSWGAPRSGGRRHQGVDMMAPYGTPVLAPVDGEMRPHTSRIGGISYYLDGDDGNEYFGTHLQSVADGGRVTAGEQIGTVGSTGNASTPHLHFEVKLDGMRSVNPYPYAVKFCR